MASAQIYLEISKDGGCSFGTARGRFLAVDGQSRHRVMWRRNGRFDTTATLRFYTNEPAVFSVGQLTVDVIGGDQ